MRSKRICLLTVMVAVTVGLALAQTKKPLANDDILQMVKAGFEQSMIVKAIEANETNFDVSVQALMDLKSAGVNQAVIEAMLAAEARKKAPPAATNTDPGSPAPKPNPPDPERERRGGTANPAVYVEEVSSQGGVVA